MQLILCTYAKHLLYAMCLCDEKFQCSVHQSQISGYVLGHIGEDILWKRGFLSSNGSESHDFKETWSGASKWTRGRAVVSITRVSALCSRWKAPQAVDLQAVLPSAPPPPMLSSISQCYLVSLQCDAVFLPCYLMSFCQAVSLPSYSIVRTQSKNGVLWKL